MSASPAELRSRRRVGAPIRFLGLTVVLWVGVRVAVASSLLASALGSAPVGTASTTGAVSPGARKPSRPALAAYRDRIGWVDPGPVRRLERIPIVRLGRDGVAMAEASGAAPRAFATGAASLPIIAAASAGRVSLAAASAVPEGPKDGHRRWSASGWLFWRAQGGGRSLGSAGQLGGSQAGVRVERALGRMGRGKGVPISGYVRMTTALSGPMAPEATIGIAVRPLSGRVPVIVGIERRIALDKNGRNAFALVAAGGLNPTRVVGNIVAEGYAQAGAVGLSRRDPFIDGRMTLTAPLGRGGRARAGLSLSGGAQPGASRLDIGPVFETRLPLGKARPRLTVEWRQRVVGNALPGSGVAVTLANDF